MEVVVVLFIVAVALVGILSLIVQSLNSQSYNKNNLIAYQLAQEGVELVRRLRDTNWLNDRAWDNNLDSKSTYYMDYRDTTLKNSPGNQNDFILRLDNKGYYVHDSTGTLPSSGFSRQISIDNVSSRKYLRLNVVVTWREHGRQYSYNLETLLYGWLYEK